MARSALPQSQNSTEEPDDSQPLACCRYALFRARFLPEDGTTLDKTLVSTQYIVLARRSAQQCSSVFKRKLLLLVAVSFRFLAHQLDR